MSESYERGVEYSWSQEEAERAGLGEQWLRELPPDAEEQLLVDITMFRMVEEGKLGAKAHVWQEIWELENSAQALKVRLRDIGVAHSSLTSSLDVQVEFISTAFYLVILPPPRDSALTIFRSVKPPIPADAAEQALSIFHKVVANRVARQGFRFWSPAVPPPTVKDKVLPEGVLKHRLYCYWLDGEFLISLRLI